MHAKTNAEAMATPNKQREILTPQSRDASTADLVPEKRLMLAVLESAVNDLRTYTVVATGRGRQLFMEVAAWFNSSTTGPFDFEGICEATGLDPDFIRSRLAVGIEGERGGERGGCAEVTRRSSCRVVRARR
jgi:hypothetical protein